MSIFKPNMAKNPAVVEFPDKLDVVRLGLYKTLSSLNAPPGIGNKEFTVFCAQAANYLVGDSLEPRADLPPETQQLIRRLQPIMPKQARELMSSASKEFREVIVYTLRMRLVVNQMLIGPDWLNTEVGKNVRSLLQEFGSEFPEGVTAKKFDQVVARVAG